MIKAYNISQKLLWLSVVISSKKLNGCQVDEYSPIQINKYRDIMHRICLWEDEKPAPIQELLNDIKLRKDDYMFKIGDKVKINCPYFNETINDKIGEVISIVHYDELSDEDYYIVKDYYLVRVNEGDKVNILSLYPEYITKIDEPTKDQITILQALYLLGYRYIACDKDGAIYAFIDCPEKFSHNWDDAIGYITIKVNEYNDIMNGICSWEDKEPILINNLLHNTKQR